MVRLREGELHFAGVGLVTHGNGGEERGTVRERRSDGKGLSSRMRGVSWCEEGGRVSIVHKYRQCVEIILLFSFSPHPPLQTWHREG